MENHVEASLAPDLPAALVWPQGEHGEDKAHGRPRQGALAASRQGQAPLGIHGGNTVSKATVHDLSKQPPVR